MHRRWLRQRAAKTAAPLGLLATCTADTTSCPFRVRGTRSELETQGCEIGLTKGEHPARDLVPPIVPLLRYASLTYIPKLGMIVPILGSKSKQGRSRRRSLADALFTKTQQRVLGVLFGHPDRSFYASELIRTAGTGSGAAQRELAKLEDSGLVVGRRVGHQKHYQANAEAPLFDELRSIVLKTVGLAEPLRDALKPLSSEIRAAFVYGSVAKASDRAASDIDLMIVSDSLSYGEVFGALERGSRQLGRQVNPTVYTTAEFSKRARGENAFVTRVLEQPKIWIIGSENDLPVAA